MGALAQLVEQRTENPCVPGSIPGGTTLKTPRLLSWGFFNLYTLRKLYYLYFKFYKKIRPGSPESRSFGRGWRHHLNSPIISTI